MAYNYSTGSGSQNMFNLSVVLVGALAMNLLLSSIRDFSGQFSKDPIVAPQGVMRVIYAFFLLTFCSFTLIQQKSGSFPVFFGGFIALAFIILAGFQISIANKGIQTGTSVVSTAAGDRTEVPIMKKDNLGIAIGSLNLIMGVVIGAGVIKVGISG